MSECVEVTLTLGYDHPSTMPEGLHDYLIAPMSLECAPHQGGLLLSGQHLDLVSSDDIYPDGHPGSGQAGAMLIYAGIIRRGNGDAIVKWLRKAPWGWKQAVAVIHDDNWDPRVEKLYDVRDPMWRHM